MTDFSFEKRHRLLDAAGYSRVFSNADVKIGCPAMLIIAVGNPCTHPRLGIVIAKKQVKLASQRNGIKRIVRESFRHRRQSLPNVDLVLIARRDLGKLDKQALAALLEKQWRRLEKRIAEP